MKRCLRTLVLAAAVLGGVASTSADAAKYKAEYKLSCVPGALSGWGMAGTYFADRVREETQGRVNIKVYHGAQLMAGKQTSEMLLVRNGAIDFALASTINWSPQLKELNLTALPFFIANQPDKYKALDALEAGKAGGMLKDIIEKAKVKFVGWAENGFREITSSKGPLEHPDDFKGLKIRVCGTPIFADIFTAIGANPQAINWSEAITGFQQGIVDGQENPTNGINVSLKMWDYHKYNTEWHYMIDPLFLTANQKVWKDFSDEDKKIIEKCAQDTEKYSKALSRIGLDDGQAYEYLKSIDKLPAVTDPYAELEKHGMTVTKYSPEQIKEFYDATAEVRAKWTKTIGEDLVAAAEADMAAVAK